MLDLLQTPTAELVLGLTGLLILIVVGVYIVLRFRDGNEHAETYSDLLTNFRDLKQGGLLNEEEYRTIRTDLESKLSQQVRDQKKGSKDFF